MADIQKVNKVSVTVLDNWGNERDRDGSRNFTRTIPFDKLAGVMTKAQVETARTAGELIESADKTGYFLRATVEESSKPNAPEPTPEAKQNFEAMRETFRAGVQVVSAPQLFPTPADVAARMVELAEIQTGDRVLEPSAGTGNILQAIARVDVKTVAVERNFTLAESLRARFVVNVDVRCSDFLECNGDLGQFERVLMNPPFENGSDIKHIQHALTMLKPGGRLVAICANGPRQNETLQPLATEWETLPEGTFAGTGVRAVLFTIDKEKR